MNTQEDFYQILEVSRDAPRSMIKAKYRELSARFHPDKKGGSADASLFQKVHEAYKTLSDPQKRKAYDEGIRSNVVSNLHATAMSVTNRFFKDEFGR